MRRDDPAWRAIADDDPELICYLKGWDRSNPKTAEVAELWPAFARPKTLQEAKRIVAKNRKEQSLCALIVDITRPREERVQAIKDVLDTLPIGHYLKQFSTERLLEKIIPAGTLRLTGGPFEGRMEPVVRPPRNFCDVWVL